ncbi:phosphatidylglycerophosphatase A [Pseudomonadales bacterium]|nr:phosphatidylglycerophosphatase A [Pseudomonadales bacterium]MDA9366400.1 phosphatidylglycerophosphatase A [Pseudomonadales bacterium]MDB4069353.1 phosphatidylglycerophosphatase A [Pseudomonadales bacterium]
MTPRNYKALTNPWHLLATGFGSGLVPKAPGTMGSVLALLLWIPLQELPVMVYGLFVLACIPFGIWLCGRVAVEMQVKDPACIVFDEFVGVWVALFMLPVGWYWPVIGFILFRLFDIFKPWPVSWLDQKLPGGWGIMLDDVAAGLFSLIILQVLALGLGMS